MLNVCVIHNLSYDDEDFIACPMCAADKDIKSLNKRIAELEAILE